MMQTNEQVVEVDGFEVGLRFDFNAIDRIHKAIGLNMLDPATAEKVKDAEGAEKVEEAMTPGQVMEIVWACYVAYHDWREEEPPLSRRKFRGLNLFHLFARMQDAREGGMPEPEEGAGEDPTPAPSGETVKVA